MWLLDSIVLADLVTSGREEISNWVPQNDREFFKIKSRLTLLGFLSQNVIVVTCVAMPAGCGLVNDV